MNRNGPAKEGAFARGKRSALACPVAIRGVILALLAASCAAAATQERQPSLDPDTATEAAPTSGQPGFLRAFMQADTLFFEVPASLLNRDFLIYQENWRDQQVLRWQRRGNRLLLVEPEVTYVAESAAPRETVSRWGWLPPILAVFPIESERADGAAIIDVTRMFTTEIQGFLGASGRTDEARSFVERVDVYPENIEIDAVQTRATPPTNAARPGGGPHSENRTTRMHWSVVQLPTDLMRPRLYDPRIGFWMEVYERERVDHLAATRGSIVRWRLEKKHPAQTVSEPIEPIVFYIDPATPEKWRPWIRKGVEAWQPAFEAAGFRNAIIAKDPPSDDPSWSVDDVRHSVVRWISRRQRDTSAGGGTAETVVDPRTGEILRANAYVQEKYEVTARDWYFTMAAPLDARAQRLPFPDSLMGALYQALVTHEVGHALGVQDGSYGKLTYPVDSLRSASWLRRMGFSPSIFNYSRHNYVAQPEDSIPPELLIPSLGPADIYTIRWGYTPIPEARTPEEEKATLESWAQVQDTAPWLRLARGYYDEELYTVFDASDDADPIRSTELGLKNLRRVMDILPQAALSPGSDNVLLQHLYDATLTQWLNEMRRVVALIGGFMVQYKSGSQPGPVYTPIPGARQRAAMAFLDTMAFRTPRWLIVPEITRRFETRGIVARVMGKQRNVLGRVLDPHRLDRMAEAEATATGSDDVYSRAELLADLRESLWSELTQRSVRIDPFRRALQQAHLMMLLDPLKALEKQTLSPLDAARRIVSQPGAYHLMLAEVGTLRDEITGAIPRAADAETRSHLELMNDIAGGATTP